MRFFCLFVICIAYNSVFAQDIHWADKLVSTTDTWNGKWFGPDKILGVPDIYPRTYGTGYGWIPGYNESRLPEKEVTAKVEFNNPIKAEQLVIVESNNPGSITLVTIHESNGKSTIVYKSKPIGLSDSARVLYIPFKKTSTPVVAATITCNAASINGWSYIDAIGTCEKAGKVNIDIRLAKDYKMIGKTTILSDAINTEHSETYPIISSDGKVLYFARSGDPLNIGDSKKTDIWYSTMNADGTWATAKNIGPPLNNDGNNFVSSTTPDVNTLLLANVYNEDGSSKGNGVSIVKKEANGWPVPKEVKIKEFQNLHQYTSYFLTGDGNTMLMGIQMLETFGKMDLYVSFKQSDGSFSKPLNLGSTINTFQEEATPFLAADGKTLYFSSNGIIGYGGYDIFMSRRLDNTWTNWSTPINLGPNINTSAGDLGFSVPASGDIAYTYAWSSYETVSDIYSIKLSPDTKPEHVLSLTGRVLNSKTLKPVDAKIEYTDLKLNKNVGEAHSDPISGAYRIILSQNRNYGYHAVANGYYAVHDNLNIDTLKNFTEINRDIYLVPIEKDARVVLQNVFFYQSTPKLIETSYPELEYMLEFLKQNPNVKIELQGHTDNVGDPDKNLKLSNDRVLVVKDYFVKNGIAATRIHTKAFGGTVPVAPNNSEENRKKNRRVEFVVIEY
jgi:outer membrane protein OmpA-like peptidoglycan-associated protein